MLGKFFNHMFFSFSFQVKTFICTSCMATAQGQWTGLLISVFLSCFILFHFCFGVGGGDLIINKIHVKIHVNWFSWQGFPNMDLIGSRLTCVVVSSIFALTCYLESTTALFNMIQWNLSITTTQRTTSLPSGAHLGGQGPPRWAPEGRHF